MKLMIYPWKPDMPLSQFRQSCQGKAAEEESVAWEGMALVTHCEILAQRLTWCYGFWTCLDVTHGEVRGKVSRNMDEHQFIEPTNWSPWCSIAFWYAYTQFISLGVCSWGIGWRLLFGGDYANKRYKTLRWHETSSDVQKHALCDQPVTVEKKHIRWGKQGGCTTIVLLV